MTSTPDSTTPDQSRLRLRFLLIAIALAVATVIAPAASATAETTAPSAEQEASDSGPAFNYRELWLKFPSPPGAESCKSREIYLAADTYTWRQFHIGHSGSSGQIYLAAGWYVWKDCIGTRDKGGYYHDTYLRRKATGGYATLERTWFGGSTGTFWEEYGSRLDR